MGDSSAILVHLDDQEAAATPARYLTADHRLTNATERDRLQALGITLGHGGTRLYGLNLGRCLGDRYLKVGPGALDWAVPSWRSCMQSSLRVAARHVPAWSPFSPSMMGWPRSRCLAAFAASICSGKPAASAVAMPGLRDQELSSVACTGRMRLGTQVEDLGLSAIPHVSLVEQASDTSTTLVIIASDGVWDVASADRIIQVSLGTACASAGVLGTNKRSICLVSHGRGSAMGQLPAFILA